MAMFDYKGYQGSIEVDVESNLLHGKILFVTDLVTYEAKDVAGLRREFEAAVDDYLTTCKQLGRDPQQPFSGAFNVRVGPQLHKAAAIRAQQDGVKLNGLMVSALEQYLNRVTVQHEHKHDHHLTVRVVYLSEVKRLEHSSYSGHPTQQFEMQTHVNH